MDKLINKLKKSFIIVGTFFSLMYTKAIAIEALYGIPQPSQPSNISMVWKIAGGLIIPLVFIIGMLIYFKKSSNSKLRKFITFFIALVIVILVCFCINYIITTLI